MCMFLFDNILNFLILSPLIGVFCLLLIDFRENRLLKLTALNNSFICFVGFLFVWACFDKSESNFQFYNKFVLVPFLNLNLALGIDGISLFFVILNCLLIPVCLLASWNSINFNVKEFSIIFLVLNFLLINVFCCLDLLFFYVFFESILIPMFIIIGVWGSRQRKTLAAYYFFLYTLVGSIVMLFGVIYLISQIGTTDYEILLISCFCDFEQKLLWFSFFLSFASKIPMVPFHLWLPEAHVEAPTPGSVLLAGILLKLGSYGFIRFSLPFFPKASFFFSPLVYTIIILSVIYGSLTAIRQTDFKRIVAYTSIAHMNVVVLGIFSFNVVGIEGAIFQSLSHGFVASSLFLIIGIVYDRYKSRLIKYYGGLASTMPMYVTIFLFFSVANIGFPGTSSFIGEFLIFLGAFKVSTEISFLAATSMVLGGAYSLWLFNRVAYGNLKTQYTKKFLDLSFRELLIFTPLIIGTFCSGVYPTMFLNVMHSSVFYLVELLYY